MHMHSRDSIKDSNSNNKLEDSSGTRSAWQEGIYAKYYVIYINLNITSEALT